MRCPTLKDLHLAPLGKIGWPWTQESPQLPDTMPDGKPWPKISIVTPSYNYARFIEETIRSVLLQGYPNLEYIIIDDGSIDNSIEIIQKYGKWLTYWEKQPNQGATYAINRGIAFCSGEVFNWLSADDRLAPGALAEVGRLYSNKESLLFIIGRCQLIEFGTGHILHDWYPKPPKQPLDFVKPNAVVMPQPSTFMALNFVKEAGNLNRDLCVLFDWELYFRLIIILRDKLNIAVTQVLLSEALRHPDAKTSEFGFLFPREALHVLRELHWRLPFFERLRIDICILNLESVESVREMLRVADKPLAHLVYLPLRRPYVLISRFYWGAIYQGVKKLLK